MFYQSKNSGLSLDLYKKDTFLFLIQFNMADRRRNITNVVSIFSARANIFCHIMHFNKSVSDNFVTSGLDP